MYCHHVLNIVSENLNLLKITTIIFSSNMLVSVLCKSLGSNDLKAMSLKFHGNIDNTSDVCDIRTSLLGTVF